MKKNKTQLEKDLLKVEKENIIKSIRSISNYRGTFAMIGILALGATFFACNSKYNKRGTSDFLSKVFTDSSIADVVTNDMSLKSVGFFLNNEKDNENEHVLKVCDLSTGVDYEKLAQAVINNDYGLSSLKGSNYNCDSSTQFKSDNFDPILSYQNYDFIGDNLLEETVINLEANGSYEEIVSIYNCLDDVSWLQKEFIEENDEFSLEADLISSEVTRGHVYQLMP